MIMIMIDNKYLFMYCMHVFMYTMNYEIVQYAKCNAGDGPIEVIETNTNRRYKLWQRANVYQL